MNAHYWSRFYIQQIPTHLAHFCGLLQGGDSKDKSYKELQLFKWQNQSSISNGNYKIIVSNTYRLPEDGHMICRNLSELIVYKNYFTSVHFVGIIIIIIIIIIIMLYPFYHLICIAFIYCPSGEMYFSWY
jgi:hypothetical protein